MTVQEMIRAYLESNGYDGLFNPGECCCKKDDLAPCEYIQMDCQAGYLAPCDCQDEHEFHIQEMKP